MRAADVMRTSFATVKPSTRVIDAARLLLETNQRGLPVLDDDGRLKPGSEPRCGYDYFNTTSCPFG
jgi:CBS domain-containing protein